jgi:hypothetical protein
MSGRLAHQTELMKVFHCNQCSSQVYFENTVCGVCQAYLLFVPSQMQMAAASMPANADLSATANGGSMQQLGLKPCAQRQFAAQCNWALPTQAPEADCISCQLTRLAASAPVTQNWLRWQLAEAAKRRLLFTLLSLRVPFAPKQSATDAFGLAFEWKVPMANTPVITGHADGVITLNLQEADDDKRESTRVAFAEPLRSVLGHLRHELSHHLQQRFVTTPDLVARFRELFGDERQPYAPALQHHYQNGPPADVSQRFISAYASAHPWEDWAETCAHYLLMVDAVETADAWGLHLDPGVGLATTAGQTRSDLGLPMQAEDLVFGHWLPVARFLNAMARSLGSRDSYPFVIPTPVLDKLRFVQDVLQRAALR